MGPKKKKHILQTVDTGKEFKRILRMKAVSPDYKDQQVLTIGT